MTIGLSANPIARARDRSPIARTDVASDGAQAKLRSKLFSAVIQGLHDSGIPYCILGAAQDLAASGESDLDFAVRPSDFASVPPLLADAAARAGGRLVQAIRHETTAAYFAIAKIRKHGICIVNPDCTTDYRREGRLWMPVEELLGGRGLGAGGFFRPAPDVDFKYYLIKQVLKQTLTDTQWAKLVTLYLESAEPECALNLWARPGNLQIESALLRNDRAAFSALLPCFASQLRSTPYREDPVTRAAAFVANGARVFSRASHPTGLFVCITNGHFAERIDLALRLAQAMAPAFRRTLVDGEFSPASTTRALIESTLVVSPNEALLARAPFGSVTIRRHPSLSPAENLERAIAAVVSHLSKRTARRLKLPSRKQCFTASELASFAKGAL